jgi:prepilin-type N-terminal cleavage/methylation domain-containing protein
MSKNLNIKKRGYTIFEILLVMSIIVAIASIAFPLILRQAKKGNEIKALSTIKDIENAVSMYTKDNHDFLPQPLAATEDIEEDSIIDTNTDVFFIRALLGYKEGMNNPKAKVYWSSALDTSGDGYGILLDNNNDPIGFTDPWNRGYKLLLDYSGDGKIVPNSIAVAFDPARISPQLDSQTLNGRCFGISPGSLVVDDGSGNLTYPEMIKSWDK